MLSLWSSPTTSPGRCFVRKPVPQARSRVRAGGIDLGRQEGAHPRVGAADVVPLVPLVPEDMERARGAALRLAERVGGELGLPVFLYGELGGAGGPAFFRRGGTEGLARRVADGELAP